MVCPSRTRAAWFTDEQNRKRTRSPAFPVSDRRDAAILRGITPHGAVLLFSADVVLGLSFRTPPRDSHCLCMRVCGSPAELCEQHYASPRNAAATGRAPLQFRDLGGDAGGDQLRDGH